MGSMDLERRVRSLEAATRNIPSRFAGGGSAPAPVAQVPWLAIQVRAGQTLISSPKKVYGIKRKVGEAKAAGWISLPEQAAATCSLTGGAVSSIALSNPGQCYTATPSVTVSAPPGGGTQAVITASLDSTAGGIVAAAWVTACGSGYTSAPTVTFSAAPGGGTTATGSAVIKNGLLVGVTVSNPGRGYTVAPTISFSGGGGASAAASCALKAQGISLAITTAGSGYASPPTIAIDAPTGPPYPTPPHYNGGIVAGTDWPDGVGFGMIRAGSLQGLYAVDQATVIVHDDRSIIPCGLVGDTEPGASPPVYSANEWIGSWIRTAIHIDGQPDEALAVIPAWVPMVYNGFAL